MPARTNPRPTQAAAAAAAASYDRKPWLSAYSAGVPHEIDVPDQVLPDLLVSAARLHPQVTALAFLGTRISYRDLLAQVERLAASLADLGVSPGDRVALVLPNCPQNVVAFHAVLRLGAIVVQTNPQYTEVELAAQLQDCGASVVICLDKTYRAVAAVRSKTAVRHIVVTSVTDYLPLGDRIRLALPLPKARRERRRLTAVVPRSAEVVSYLTLLRAPAGRVEPAATKPGDTALIQYTTGTTGPSKGAMLTHRNLIANGTQCVAWLPDAQQGREVTLAVLPLFHVYGLTLCLTTTTMLAGTLVLLPRFDQGLVLAAIAEHKPTLFPGVPPLYKALLDNPKTRSADLRSVRACVSGAMRLPVETQTRFETVTGGQLVEGYGMTETSPVALCNPLSPARRPGTVGLPMPSTEARVVSITDPAVPVPVGETGELAIRGPQVFAGYWAKPEEDAAILTADGWLLTGDIAVMDSDGFFEIVDRKKELIVAGGFNISPAEVEGVIALLAGVAEVCVVGVPDRYRGESVKAFVVLEPGVTLRSHEVMAWAASRLTAYKVPKVVEFRDSLPLSGVGKIARNVLRDEERAKASHEALAATPRGAAVARAKPLKKPVATKKAAKPAPAKKSTSTKTTPKKSAG